MGAARLVDVYVRIDQPGEQPQIVEIVPLRRRKATGIADGLDARVSYPDVGCLNAARQCDLGAGQYAVQLHASRVQFP